MKFPIVKSNVLIWSILLLFFMASFVGANYVFSDKGVIELNKEQSLKLMNLRFIAASTQGDLNDYVALLSMQYKVNLQTHNLDAVNGRFVPISDPEEIVGDVTEGIN